MIGLKIMSIGMNGSLWNEPTKVCPNLRVEDSGNCLGVVVGLNMSLED